MTRKELKVEIPSLTALQRTIAALDISRNALYNGMAGEHRRFLQRYKRKGLGLTIDQSASIFDLAAGLLRNIRHAYDDMTEFSSARLGISWNEITGRGSVRVRQNLPSGARPVNLAEIRKTRPHMFRGNHSGPGLVFELENPKGLRFQRFDEAGLTTSRVSIHDKKNGTERVAKVTIRRVREP